MESLLGQALGLNFLRLSVEIPGDPETKLGPPMTLTGNPGDPQDHPPGDSLGTAPETPLETEFGSTWMFAWTLFLPIPWWPTRCLPEDLFRFPGSFWGRRVPRRACNYLVLDSVPTILAENKQGPGGVGHGESFPHGPRAGKCNSEGVWGH